METPKTLAAAIQWLTNLARPNNDGSLGEYARALLPLVERASVKEWPLDIWVVTRAGRPFDWRRTRAMAFKAAKQYRTADGGERFWTVAPAKAVLVLPIRANGLKE